MAAGITIIGIIAIGGTIATGIVIGTTATGITAKSRCGKFAQPLGFGAARIARQGLDKPATWRACFMFATSNSGARL